MATLTRPFSSLKGQTFVYIAVNDEGLRFKTDAGREFKLYHPLECCETVFLDEVAGDFNDLLGTPINVAEVESNADDPPHDVHPNSESYRWTFYKLGTVKGWVDMKWFGCSNGNYSESATLKEIVN